MKKYFLCFAIILMIGVTERISYAQSSSVKINEIFSRGTTTEPDWIEIYNGSTSAIDISSYKIYDSGAKGGTKEKKTFPAGTTIAAKGFYVIVVDGSAASDFGLSNSGEEVWLEDGTGTVVDDVTFPALAAGETYARVPDGSTTWKILTTYTKGATNGTSTGIYTSSAIRTTYQLQQNYPNPFNPTTKIQFSIPKSGIVRLSIYNILGQEVASLLNQELSQGLYSVNFDASNLDNGVYIYSIQAGDFSQTKKMILLK
jgi:hypothetical protein